MKESQVMNAAFRKEHCSAGGKYCIGAKDNYSSLKCFSSLPIKKDDSYSTSIVSVL